VALPVGHQSRDSQVVGLSPTWAQPSISYLHLCASVTKQYNLAVMLFGCEGHCGPGRK